MFKQAQIAVLISDCEALVVPTAIPITIPSGTQVQLTQTKGNSITVFVGGQLARIEGSKVGALGLDPADFANNFAKKEVKEITAPANLDEINYQLKQCFDPEIPVNVYDLGLIYSVDIQDENDVIIFMTLTAPGCSMGPVLMSDVESAVSQAPNVRSVRVELVFDPPWNQNMMTEVARLELGLL